MRLKRCVLRRGDLASRWQVATGSVGLHFSKTLAGAGHARIRSPFAQSQPHQITPLFS